MYWSARTYSKYSIRVALPTVSSYVAAAAERGHPAIAITDTGTLSGAVELYKSARSHDINPIPGMDVKIMVDKGNGRPLSGTISMLALNTHGYRNLALITRVAHVHNRTGMLDLGDLASAAEAGVLDGIACLAGPPATGLIPVLLTHADPTSSKNVLAAIHGWFGGGAYMELAPHQDTTVDAAVEAQSLAFALAQSIGVPTLITAGARYLEPTDQQAWQTLNDINEGTELHVPRTYPLHFHHEEEVRQWFTERHWTAAMANMAILAETAKVKIPELDAFTIAVPDVSAPRDPDQDLMDRVSEAIFARIEKGIIPADKQDAYYERMNQELEIVFEAGFSGYLLFTATVTDWIRGNDIICNTRGSAAASLLCWLLDITSIDPLAWGLAFDRFLSRDRAKPPDVDIDVDPSRRPEIVEWLASTFPTLRIATFSTGKVSDTEPLTGSLVVQYKAMLRRTGQDADVPLDNLTENRLRRLSAHEPYLSVGVGAAGFIVAPDESTINAIGVHRVDSSDTVVSAFEKEDVEAMGYVKLDVLGVTTLSALRMLKESTGVGWDIPTDDKTVYSSLASGKTGGLFQLEGRTFTSGMKRLKPTKLTDLVAAMALFRPAAMQSDGTDAYLRRRFRQEPTPKRHPLIERHVSETYGVLLYQEQAIGLLRDMGLTPEEIEDARKAIKASNAAVGAAERKMRTIVDKVMSLGKKEGMSLEDLAWLSEAMQAYANYGFNKAHAVSYALVAYQTAWYKVHYPLQFWVAFLTVYTGTDHEKKYLKEIREAKITVRGAHVNKSGTHYSIDTDGKSIRKGLTSIKGVGEAAAEDLAAHAPYTSLADLAARCNARKVTGAKALAQNHRPDSCGGVIAALAAAGALDELT